MVKKIEYPQMFTQTTYDVVCQSFVKNRHMCADITQKT